MTDEERPREGLRWKVTKAVRASRLTSPSKLVMLVLADVADTGTAEIPTHRTPSLTVLANETGLSRSTVAAHLRALEADGWVVRIRPETVDALGKFERTRYQLRVPSAVADLVQEMDGVPSAGDGPPSAGDGNPSAGNGPPSAADGHRNRSSSDLDQISTDQEPPSSEIAIPERTDVEHICRHLADSIEANGSKRPTVTKKWRTEARLLLDKDGRTVDQVTRAIDWCQADEFWRSNILSMPKLREKYDQLRLAAQRNGNGHSRPSTTDQRVAAGLELARRYAEEEAS